MPESPSTRRPEAADSATVGAEAPSRRGRFPSVGIALAIARVELRRALRRIREHDLWLAAMAILVLPTGLFLWVTFQLARDVGESLAAGESGAASAVPTLLLGALVLHVGLFLATAVGSQGAPDNAAGLLTIRPTKDVAAGLLVSIACQLSPYLFLGVAAGYAGLAVGIGSPLPPIGGLAAALAVLVVAGSVGFPLGLLGKGLARRSRRLTRLKPVVGAAVAVAYFYVMFTGTWQTLLDWLEPALRQPPLAWFGDLALATTPGADASVAGALAAVGLTAVVLPLGVLATVSAAEYAWFADRQRPGDGDGGDGAAAASGAVAGAGSSSAGAASGSAGAASAGSTARGDSAADERGVLAATGAASRAASAAGGAVLDALCRRSSTRGVATVVLRRAYRRPILLLYAAVPLLFALPLVEQLLAAGELPWYAPWLVVLFGAWIAGETFPLNVLGNQGAVLPTVLTARADGRAIVNGHVAAVSLPMAPVTAVLAAAAAVVAGRPPVQVALVSVAGVVAVVGAAVLAAGYGTLFPRFDELTVAGSHEVAVPSKRALAAFSLTKSLAVIAAAMAVDETARLVGSLLLSEHVPWIAVEPATLRTVGWIVLALLVAAVPAAYLVAVRRIDSARVD